MRHPNGAIVVFAVAMFGACAAETSTSDADATAPSSPATQSPGATVMTGPAATGKPSETNATMGKAGVMAPSAAPPGTEASPMSTPTPSAPAASAGMPMAPSDAPAMDECGLKTRFPGDQYCIKPPPADKGFQLHIGPTDYENPDPKYVLEPGQEVTETFPAVSGNEREVFYFYRQQRMRPGSHHLLIRTNTTNDLIVSAQNPISDTPSGGKIAPEDQDVGFVLGARTPLSVNLHFINTTEKPILKEMWVNFWYKDEGSVKEPATAIFTGTPVNIPPGQHVILSSDCTIRGNGRILRLFGHKHANNVRWSSYRIRGAQKDLLFEDYEHWEEPLILEYSSLITNPKPDAATKSPGGWSGIVDLQPGDVFRFECEVVNATDRTFTGENEAIDDEMCIQNGTVVGTRIGAGAGMFGGGGCVSAQTPVRN